MFCFCYVIRAFSLLFYILCFSFCGFSVLHLYILVLLQVLLLWMCNILSIFLLPCYNLCATDRVCIFCVSVKWVWYGIYSADIKNFPMENVVFSCAFIFSGFTLSLAPFCKCVHCLTLLQSESYKSASNHMLSRGVNWNLCCTGRIFTIYCATTICNWEDKFWCYISQELVFFDVGSWMQWDILWILENLHQAVRRWGVNYLLPGKMLWFYYLFTL